MTALQPEAIASKLARLRRARDEARGVSHEDTSAAPVVAHLEWLLGLGFSQEALAASRGVTQSTLWHTLHSETDRMRGVVAHSWLAVTPQVVFASADDHQRVPAFASLRRYRALQAIGWDVVSIGERGLKLTGTHPLPGLLTVNRQVNAARHRSMAAVYADLEHKPGPSPRTRAIARNRGHLPPAAWDDIDDPREDPTATPWSDDPDMVAVERALTGVLTRLSPHEIDAAIALGLTRNMTAGDIARALDMSHAAVQARISRKKLRQEAAA